MVGVLLSFAAVAEVDTAAIAVAGVATEIWCQRPTQRLVDVLGKEINVVARARWAALLCIVR